MALILSLETSTTVCSVALHQNGQLLSSSEILIQKSHSQVLTLLAQNCIELGGYTLKDLDAVAVSAGPGSYTGLRIGTSTAKGLSFSLDLPVIALDTLDIMVLDVLKYNMHDTLLCPMIDARRMEVYCQVSDSKGCKVEPTQSKVIDGNSFNNLLADHEIIFFGNGSGKCKDLFKQSGNAKFLDGIYPNARSMGELAEDYFKRASFVNVISFEPFYLKEFISTGLKK